MKQMDIQLQSLDDILARVKTQNGLHHEAHIQSLTALATTVHQSYSNIGSHLTESSIRAQQLEQDITHRASVLAECLQPLQNNVHAPLTDLRSVISSTKIQDYVPTGVTPHKLHYSVPSELPHTAEHEAILARFHGQDVSSLPSTTPKSSPTKTTVFADSAEASTPAEAASSVPSPDITRKSSRPGSAIGGLKEVDINVAASAMVAAVPSETSRSTKEPSYQRPLKRQNTGSIRMHRSGEERDLGASIGPGSKLPKKTQAEGRENVPFGASMGPREGRSLRPRAS
jgi:kinesin family protein 11